MRSTFRPAIAYRLNMGPGEAAQAKVGRLAFGRSIAAALLTNVCLDPWSDVNAGGWQTDLNELTRRATRKPPEVQKNCHGIAQNS